MGWLRGGRRKRPNDFFDEEVQEKHAELVWTISLEFWGRVTMRTPVDTGRLKANWSLTAYRDTSTTESTATTTPSRPSREPFPVLYVQNSLPYVVPIEYGLSQENAPLGMFRITLAEFDG